MIPQARTPETPEPPGSTVPMPAEVAVANLALTAGALDGWFIPHWLVRDEGHRYRIAVPARSRAAVLRALATLGPPVRAELVAADGASLGVVDIADLPEDPVTAPIVRVYRPVSTLSFTYGPRYGADIEFWTADGPLLRAPRPTLIGAEVPADTPTVTIRVGGRDYPTFEPFTRRLPTDIVFPIDAVYPWSGGEWLRYSLRSLEMFAPWIRRVWIVTDRRAPRWLDTGDSRITVMDHSSFVDGRVPRPTANHHAIQAQLHRIPGVAEHFLYLDRVLLGQPMAPGRFFQANGTARFFPSDTPVPFTPISDDEPLWTSAAKNDRVLLEREFGWTLTHAVRRAPHALRRSVLADIEDWFDDDMRAMLASQRPSRTDVSVATSLHHWFGFLTGRAVPADLDAERLDAADSATLNRLLVGKRTDSFCLDGNADRTAFLQSYFPVRASMELTGPRTSVPIVQGGRTMDDETTAGSSQPAPRTLDDVPGWLKKTDALLFEWLLTDQAGPEGTGDLLEIGVFQGKSAIHMGRFLRAGERFTVCDLFDVTGDERPIRPGARKAYRDLTQAIFERNYLAFHERLPVVVRAKSDVIVEHVAAGTVRFAHIDGSHVYEHVRTDLLSARKLMKPDGIVVFDDYRTEHTPGTAAAVWEAMITEGLNVICVSANKFYATWGDAVDIQERLIKLVTASGDHRIDFQTVLGQRLLRVVPIAGQARATIRTRSTPRQPGPRPWSVHASGWRRAAAAVLPPIVTEALRDLRRVKSRA